MGVVITEFLEPKDLCVGKRNYIMGWIVGEKVSVIGIVEFIKIYGVTYSKNKRIY